jgi:hypothetical protein
LLLIISLKKINILNGVSKELFVHMNTPVFQSTDVPESASLVKDTSVSASGSPKHVYRGSDGLPVNCTFPDMFLGILPLPKQAKNADVGG